MRMQLIHLVVLGICLTGCLQKHNTFQGYVEGKYTYVASAISGNLAQLPIKRGDQVKINQLLFTLDPEPEASKLKQTQQQLAQAQQVLVDLQKGQRQTIIDSLHAQRSQAEAEMNFAAVTLQRYTILHSKAAIDKEAVDRARSTYDRSRERIKEIDANLAEAKQGARENVITAQQATVEALTASVKQATWALEQKTVNSPVTAEVFDTLYEPGEFVVAGRPVVSLLPPDKLKVVFFVPEKVVGKIHVGEGIAFGCDNCETIYTAAISFISPNAEYTPPVIYSQESRDKLVYRIEANLKPELALKLHPGQPLDVTLSR